MTANRAFQEASPSLFGFAPAEDECVALPVGDPASLRAAPGRAAGTPSYLADHRARLRDRFMTGGADAMPDYELLELILFRAVPRQDMKPLARRLLDHFGDFNRVLTAPPRQLEQVAGVGPAIITELKIVAASAQRLARSRVINRPVLSGWDALLDYCHTAMAHDQIEQFRVLYLDRKNVLIADDQQARGTVDHVPVYPREIVRRALDLNATAMILVHNHPTRSIRSRWSTHKHAETLANSGIFGIA